MGNGRLTYEQVTELMCLLVKEDASFGEITAVINDFRTAKGLDGEDGVPTNAVVDQLVMEDLIKGRRLKPVQHLGNWRSEFGGFEPTYITDKGRRRCLG